jgi:hypothetical protein
VRPTARRAKTAARPAATRNPTLRPRWANLIHSRERTGAGLGLAQVPGGQRQKDGVAEDDDDQREPTDQEQRVGGRCRGGYDGRSRAPRRTPGSRRPRLRLGGLRLLRRTSVDLPPAGGLRSRRLRDHRGTDDRRRRRHGNRRLRLWRGRRRWLNRLRLRLNRRRGRRRRRRGRRRLTRRRLRSRARHGLRLGRGRVRLRRGLRGRPLGECGGSGAQSGAAEYDDNRCLPQQRSTGAGQEASSSVAARTAGPSRFGM